MSFHCELCQKTYARVHEYEAHLGSHDHQHKKRFKEMREMQRVGDTSARREREREREEEELRRISGDNAIKMTLRTIESQPVAKRPESGFRKAFTNDGENRSKPAKGSFKPVFSDLSNEVKGVKGLKDDESSEQQPAGQVSPVDTSTTFESDDQFDTYNPEFPTSP